MKTSPNRRFNLNSLINFVLAHRDRFLNNPWPYFIGFTVLGGCITVLAIAINISLR